MRPFLALSVTLTCALSWAQDYVVTKAGKRVECRIVEEKKDEVVVTIKGKRYSVKKADLKEWKRVGAPEAVEKVEAVETVEKVEGREKAEPPEVGAGVKGKVNSLVKKLAQPRTDSNPINHKKLTRQLAALLRRKDAAEYARHLLRGGPAKARGWVALALAQAGAKEAAGEVLELVRSYPPAEVPVSAIEAVGRFGGDEAAKALMEIFPGLTAFKKQRAITALGYTRSRWAAPFLMQLMEGDDGRARGAAKIALIALGQKSDAVAKRIAERAVKAKHPEEYVSMFPHLGGHANLGVVRNALGSDDPKAQRAAAQAVGQLKDRRSVGTLLELLMEREGPVVLRLQCAVSLKNIGQDSVVPELVELLERPGEDRRVRRAVHETLKALTGEDLPASASVWKQALVREPVRERRFEAPAASVASVAGGAPAPEEVVLPAESRPTGPPPEVRTRRAYIVGIVLGAVLVIAVGGHAIYSRLRKPEATAPRRRKRTR